MTWNDKIYLSIRNRYKDKHSYLIYKKESISEKKWTKSTYCVLKLCYINKQKTTNTYWRLQSEKHPKDLMIWLQKTKSSNHRIPLLNEILKFQKNIKLNSTQYLIKKVPNEG